MSNVIDFDGARIKPYVFKTLELFLMDPPDTAFQMGYLAGIAAVAREGLGQQDDARLQACETILSGSVPLSTSNLRERIARNVFESHPAYKGTPPSYRIEWEDAKHGSNAADCWRAADAAIRAMEEQP